MPALSFSVFKDKIVKGIKNQTIRPKRKNPIKVEDWLAIYWKQRSPKESEKLGESICSEVFPIIIYDGMIYCLNEKRFFTKQETDELIWMDGFPERDEFFDFFREHYGFPFEGDVIRWYPLEKKRTFKNGLRGLWKKAY